MGKEHLKMADQVGHEIASRFTLTQQNEVLKQIKKTVMGIRQEQIAKLESEFTEIRSSLKELEQS